MVTAREAWLKLTREDAIDPDLAICDPHHHLWYQDNEGYSLEDFVKDASGGHRIVQTVYIESRKMLRLNTSPEMQPVGETEYVRDLLDRSAVQQSGNSGIASGIVGFADLSLGKAVVPVLEAHIAAGRGRFKGIRFITTWDASPEIRSSSVQGIMASSRFREGFACLKRYGLSFDAWLYHPQLMELADLARAYPDTPIILDHIGGPLGIGPYAKKRDEVFQHWKEGMEALASCENVFVKLGGLGMEISGFGWHNRPEPPDSTELAEEFSPYFSWCVQRFGVDRCMFESNFPVDKRSYSYTILWNAFKHLSKDYSTEERKALFHDTAVRAYHLPEAA